MFRTVEVEEWCVSEALGTDRSERLVNVPDPLELLELTRLSAMTATAAKRVSLHWQEADDAPGYFRLIARIPIDEIAFDQLFNGRSGYRAQYYLSPEEGIIFNRRLVDNFEPVVSVAFEQAPLAVRFDAVTNSLLAPHAKIWIYEERDAFDNALIDGLNPRRWIINQATRGRRAPLPPHCTIELKGAFIDERKHLFVDELKLARPCDLHLRGYT
jgi:hypothetical protein